MTVVDQGLRIHKLQAVEAVVTAVRAGGGVGRDGEKSVGSS